MTAYAARSDLEARYGANQLSQRLDRDGDGAEDTGVLASAIASASALADSYLGQRYAVPLQAPIDPAVAEAVSTMAWKFLWGGDATEQIADDFARAERFLARVGKGEANINHALVSSFAMGAPQIAAPDPVFSRETLKDF
ncbi:MAG: DUF1320 family protein [Rhodospirillales bacterium]|nr:DUF1320 family protein [Rhodospirillales bacterium]